MCASVRGCMCGGVAAAANCAIQSCFSTIYIQYICASWSIEHLCSKNEYVHKIRENDFYNKEYGIENGKSTSAIKDSYIFRDCSTMIKMVF